MTTLAQGNEDFTQLYDALYAAQLAAVAQARPGVTAESVDRAARSVIEAVLR